MARVKFTHDFDYKPTPNITIGYLAGREETVKQDCADKAIAAGKAVSMDKPRKETDNGEKA
ncbi:MULTISPECIES: hypothetical protein [unclassified Phyllobacterium]|uniref:hypothetical protein n=1 Tax=unclassified Phyllobacterium TaxID=2638441 RepID=UPI003012C0DE